MRVISSCTVAVAALCLMRAAQAYPDGAPWGAAIPAAEQNCASCHFGLDPVHDSESLIISGLPDRPEPETTYELIVVFDAPGSVSAGFQLIALAEDGRAGTIVSAGANLEFIGSSVRSTVPQKSDGEKTWAINWRAPDEASTTITFYVAASAANDDQSPFGDTIHFRALMLQ